jgi:L-seryl-tRNA(Ser) seleniumtransferase
MVDASALGLPVEPTASQSLLSGADVVVVSGDKLLGGPQAGIIVGRGDLIAQMRKNPLCRALRVDKVTLAGLEATLRLYRDPARALERVPTLAMLSASAPELEARAASLATALSGSGVDVSVTPVAGAVGGGTYPGTELPGFAVRIVPPAGADRLARALRTGEPPIVARIEDDALLLDVRTLLPGQEEDLVRRVTECWLDSSTTEAAE